MLDELLVTLAVLDARLPPSAPAAPASPRSRVIARGLARAWRRQRDPLHLLLTGNSATRRAAAASARQTSGRGSTA